MPRLPLPRTTRCDSVPSKSRPTRHNLEVQRPGKSVDKLRRGENTNTLVLAHVEQVVVTRYNHPGTGNQRTLYKFVIIGVVAHDLKTARNFNLLRDTSIVIEDSLQPIFRETKRLS